MALDNYYHNKIEAMKLEILKGQAVLRRLEAQRNDYNSRVRLLREELGLLQQPGSYVGEVVKVMGTKKVLVKVHPEGKYGMNTQHHYAASELENHPMLTCHSRRCCRIRRCSQTHSRQESDPAIRFLQAREDSSVFRRSPRISHDGRKGTRQYVRHDRWFGSTDQGDQGGHRARIKAPRALRIPRHRTAKGCVAVRASRNRQDAAGPSRRPPHRLQVHPSVRLRAGTEVHR